MAIPGLTALLVVGGGGSQLAARIRDEVWRLEKLDMELL